MSIKHKPFDEPSIKICTCASLRKAARLVTQQYDAALRQMGLRATQFTILAALANKQEMRQSDLANMLGMEGTTLTRNLQPLFKKDWIRIDRDTDQRVRLISLTQIGQQIYADAKPLWLQVQTRFVNQLGQGSWLSLVEALETTAGIAEQD